jgi:PBSX family phage terminase large subunit
MININLPNWREVVNEPFWPMWGNRDDIIFNWGGRGGGKSIAVLRYLILKSFTEPGFKCILIRNVYADIKDSMWDAIRDECETFGVSDHFHFTKNPLEITNKVTGGKFICRGLDKPEKLRGIKEPTFAWFEEGNQMSESAWITVSTSLRGNMTPRLHGGKMVAPHLQQLFSFNPETHGEDFESFWLYKKFFAKTTHKTFRSAIETEMRNEKTGKIEPIKLTYTSIWSTYHSNPFVTQTFIAQLETLKLDNPYYHQIFALGNWGNRANDAPFYKTFKMSNNVRPTEYDNTLPLLLSFDENVNPYLTLTIHQLHQGETKTSIHQIDEILLEHPKNTLVDVCAEFANRYREHTESVVITGDRTSKKADAKLEKGQNFFTLAEKHLMKFNPVVQLPSQNPNVKSRGEFVNDIFIGRHPQLEIVIGSQCATSVADYLNVVEAPDGTKHKAKTRDKDTGVSFERFGHTSDSNDYVHIHAFKTEYLAYINGNKRHEHKTGKRRVLNSGKNRI